MSSLPSTDSELSASLSCLICLESSFHFDLDSLLSICAVLSEVSNPLAALRILENSSVAWSDNSLSWLLVVSFLLSIWLGNDCGVNFFVKVFASLCLSSREAFLPMSELSLEFRWVLLLE